MTHLAVPITESTTQGAAASIKRAVTESGADAIELRLDFMKQADLQAVAEAIPEGTKVIVTARDRSEGGVWDATDEQRIEALIRAMEIRPDYVDIELATWRRCPEARERLRSALDSAGCGLILSAHDFEKRPDDVAGRLTDMASEPCDVAKIVWQGESICDVLTCFEMMQSRQGGKPVIAIAMGEAGAMSRILAGKFGAFLSFASLSKESGSAPGQITVDEMKTLYRWDQAGPETPVYGVIGCPIMHSMSPAIHNSALRECGVDGVYVPMRVEPGFENFEPFVRGMMARPWMDLRGLSVTIPHKENALKLVGEKAEPLARRIGAVNTLVFDGPDDVRGLNTDYAGALDALTEAMGCERSDLADVPVVVLGAGGASRAIVAGLRHCGCKVTIYNRTHSRAVSLAEEFGCQVGAFDRIDNLDATIVVNTTSVGMHPNVDDAPLRADVLRPDMVVFDNVYNPMETRLLRQAAEVGCKTVSGVDMFVNQAVAQFEAWTRQAAPRELMRRVVVEKLTGQS